MRNLISTLVLIAVSAGLGASPVIDAEIYKQAQNTEELNCENCAEVASAILSMHERLCGIALEQSSFLEVKESHIYEYALKEVNELNEKGIDTFILAIQKGANCVDELDWEEKTAFYYKRLSRAKKKPKKSLLFWRDDDEE